MHEIPTVIPIQLSPDFHSLGMTILRQCHCEESRCIGTMHHDDVAISLPMKNVLFDIHIMIIILNQTERMPEIDLIGG